LKYIQAINQQSENISKPKPIPLFFPIKTIRQLGGWFLGGENNFDK
jgi:hypothetical protein